MRLKKTGNGLKSRWCPFWVSKETKTWIFWKLFYPILTLESFDSSEDVSGFIFCKIESLKVHCSPEEEGYLLKFQKHENKIF
jgi:hypothetical protein